MSNLYPGFNDANSIYSPGFTSGSFSQSNIENKTGLVVIQPTSFCNINCKYCYVPDRTKNILISDSILETAMEKLLASDMLSDNVMFLWHSGEPLTVGIKFYEKMIGLINKYNVKNKKVQNSIQTNATLIDEKWCNFFKEHDFKIGISLDGPEFLHNENRVGWDKRGTFNKVMNAVGLLKKHGFPLSAICVVTLKTLEHGEELFNFFIENEFSRLSLTLEDIMGANKATTFSRSENESLNEIKTKYANFINTIFKLWLPVKDKIYIREFAELLGSLSKIKANKDFKPIPQEVMDLNIITIQNNGKISTYCPELASGTEQNQDAFVIGNIMDLNELSDILSSQAYLKIREEVREGTSNCQNSCQYFKLCGGRSPSNKVYETGTFTSTETFHCILHRQVLINTVLQNIKLLSNTNAST